MRLPLLPQIAVLFMTPLAIVTFSSITADATKLQVNGVVAIAELKQSVHYSLEFRVFTGSGLLKSILPGKYWKNEATVMLANGQKKLANNEINFSMPLDYESNWKAVIDLLHEAASMKAADNTKQHKNNNNVLIKDARVLELACVFGYGDDANRKLCAYVYVSPAAVERLPLLQQHHQNPTKDGGEDVKILTAGQVIFEKGPGILRNGYALGTEKSPIQMGKCVIDH